MKSQNLEMLTGVKATDYTFSDGSVTGVRLPLVQVLPIVSVWTCLVSAVISSVCAPQQMRGTVLLLRCVAHHGLNLSAVHMELVARKLAAAVAGFSGPHSQQWTMLQTYMPGLTSAGVLYTCCVSQFIGQVCGSASWLTPEQGP